VNFIARLQYGGKTLPAAWSGPLSHRSIVEAQKSFRQRVGGSGIRVAAHGITARAIASMTPASAHAMLIAV
jgi:hypothetical protein